MTPIVQHKKSGLHYEYLGNNRFRNLTTGKEGEVEEDKAALVFTFCLELTEMVNDNPEIIGLLKIGFKQR